MLWLLITAVALVMRPLLPVDETRYLSVAWEMWQRQDFLVPYLNGTAYSHKPPLLFWLIHAVWAITGVHEWSARLIPHILALIVLWQSASLARRLWPDRSEDIERMALWLLFGGWFFILFLTLVQFDLLLTLMVLLAWQGLLIADTRPRSGWLVAGIATGLGILAKGPVIFLFVLPVALLAPWWRINKAVGSWYGGLMLSVLLAAGVALSWAIPAGIAGGEAYRDAIFWGQSAGRMVDSFAHRSPWWTYLAALPVMLLPWLLWPKAWRSMGSLGAVLNEQGIRFILAATIPALILFSLISGKQPKYILPILPLLCVLVARLLISFGQPADVMKKIRNATLTSVAIMLALHLVVIPVMRPAYDLTAFSQQIAALQLKHVPVAHLGKYHGQFHFLGRLDQPVEALPFDQTALQIWLEQHPQAYLVMYDRQSALPVPDAVFSQSYRSGRLVLWPVELLLKDRKRLDALLANA